MSYGIEIRNSDGNLIIEEGFKNFQVVAFGTTNAGSVIPYANNFSTGGLVFGRPSGVNQNDAFGWHIGGNSTSGSFVGFNSGSVSLVDPVQNRPNSFSGNSTTYDYTITPITRPYVGKMAPSVDWVYVEPSATSPNGADYGLEVYAADGTVSYSSVVESEFDLAAVTTVTNFDPPLYGDDDYHATGFFSASDSAFNYYMCLSNLLSFPITTIPGFYGWINSGRWTSGGITFYQPAWNIANFTNVGQQVLLGKYIGTSSGSQSGGSQTQNLAPTYISGVASSYNLSSSGITITPVFSDPEGGQITILTNSAGTLGGATVSLINNGTQVRVVPGSNDASFSLTITGSDGTQGTSRVTAINYTAPPPANTAPSIASSSVSSSYSLQGNTASQTISPFVTDSEGDSYTLSASVSGSSTGMFVTVNTNNTITVSWNGATSSLSFTLNITAVDEHGAVSNTVSTLISWSPSSGGQGPQIPPGGLPGGGGFGN